MGNGQSAEELVEKFLGTKESREQSLREDIAWRKAVRKSGKRWQQEVVAILRLRLDQSLAERIVILATPPPEGMATLNYYDT